MKVYKIRNKTTGLFSNGGETPTWSKTGKIWKAIGYLKNHLNQFKGYHAIWNGTIESHYKDCEIIEYDLESSMTETVTKDVE